MQPTSDLSELSVPKFCSARRSASSTVSRARPELAARGQGLGDVQERVVLAQRAADDAHAGARLCRNVRCGLHVAHGQRGDDAGTQQRGLAHLVVGRQRSRRGRADGPASDVVQAVEIHMHQGLDDVEIAAQRRALGDRHRGQAQQLHGQRLVAQLGMQIGLDQQQYWLAA